ncbi:MAG: thioredoxin family protein [Deltaproteobacteria bacterium]|nr:thioredoxin family protein [Kofleriaceae bacterium]
MRTAAAALLSFSLALVGCKKSGDEAKGGSAASGAGVASATGPCTGAEAHGPLAWFEDDYAAALACAKATRRPLVIDMWAPWCHTCIAMQTTVLRDASLAPFADRFVFLAVDTDREKNAAVVAKLPLQNWPTFFVLSPDDESVQERWLGAASVEQFRTLLKDGEAAYLAARDGAALDPLLAKLRAGNQAATRKDWAAAAGAWSEVIASAPANWPRRSDVLVSLVSAHWKADDVPACLDLALARAGETGNTANATDFLVWSLMCAGDEAADPAKARAVRELAVARLTPLVDDPAAPLSIDDRADAMMNLRNALDALGKQDEAKAMAERSLAYLADAAAKAPDAWAASTHNWPRAEVHVWLGRGLELVPALEKSAADLPTEYDPPYRLAWVLMKSGEPEKAKPWAEKAVSLAYGARKVRIVGLLIEVEKARGDRAGEKVAREQLVKVLESLPPEQAQPEALAKAKAELAAMDEPAAPPAAVN